MGTQVNGKSAAPPSLLRSPAVGIEAEFSLFIDDHPQPPETVFGSPRAFIRGPLQHRLGTSYQLHTGAAVYFDTGVIELATPPIELDRGCVARGVRLLWESIAFIRGELDAWEQRSRRSARLVGFSTHYNVSVEWGQRHPRRLDAMARLLTYILAPPVMLLAANRLSNGVGVRPRGNRIEITVDFTPNIAMMIAAGSLIAGIVREVSSWRAFTLRALDSRDIPRIHGFSPMPHTSRKGWLARFDRFPQNPLANDPNAALWRVPGRAEPASLRQIAVETFRHFRRPIARIGDPATVRHTHAILAGRRQSFLDLDERPAEYESVGLCTLPDAYSHERLARSQFEEIVRHAMAHDKLRIGDEVYTATGMHGWSHIAFRRDSDGRKITLSLDDLVEHRSGWTRGRG